MIILTYGDDFILIANKKETLDQFIYSLANGIKRFEFTDEGAIDKYMGVEIEQLKGKEIYFTTTFPHSENPCSTQCKNRRLQSKRCPIHRTFTQQR